MFVHNPAKMNDCNPALHFPKLLNVRDLGGHPTVDGRLTHRRSLLRSDDLAQLTPAGVRALADYGLETVLDLRWPEEIALWPSPVSRIPGLHYAPVSLLAESPSQWRELSGGCAKEQWKCAVLEHLRPQLRLALGVIAAAPGGPLLFHCVAGKDRTGLIAALLLALADAVPEAIAADYAASAECLREAYLGRYADSDPEAIIEAVRCPEEGVYNMLAYLESRGGVRPYLQTIGLDAAQIDRLRARLRPG